MSFAECLKDAQRLGYAEANPSLTSMAMTPRKNLRYWPASPSDQGRPKRVLCRRHFFSAGIFARRGRTRLSRKTARGCGGYREGDRSSACIRPWCRKLLLDCQWASPMCGALDAVAPMTCGWAGGGRQWRRTRCSVAHPRRRATPGHLAVAAAARDLHERRRQRVGGATHSAMVRRLADAAIITSAATKYFHLILYSTPSSFYVVRCGTDSHDRWSSG